MTITDLKPDTLPITIECATHGWMKAYVRVFDHPYAALSDEDGKFEIPLAPAGQYQLKVWHPYSGWLGGSKAKATIPDFQVSIG